MEAPIIVWLAADVRHKGDAVQILTTHHCTTQLQQVQYLGTHLLRTYYSLKESTCSPKPISGAPISLLAVVNKILPPVICSLAPARASNATMSLLPINNAHCTGVCFA